MKFSFIRKGLIVSATAIYLTCAALSAQALSMSDMVGNYTSSTVSPNSRISLDSRRGMISGGSVRVRFENQGMPELYNVQLPSFKADCNGMDMHLGALSWISADEFMDAARALASPEVLIYALSLALQQMCGPCAQLMRELQDKLNQFQNLLKTSCEEIGTALYEKSGMKAGAAELNDRFWGEAQAETEDDAAALSGNIANVMIDSGKQAVMSGNAVWDHLKDVEVGGWLANATDEDVAKQVIMSLSGTVVIDATDATSDDQIKRDPFNPAPPSLKDIIDGEGIRGLKCNETVDCLKPTYDMIIELDALSEEFFRMLDPRSPTGIPTMFSIHYDGITLTSEQTAFLEAARRHLDIVYVVRTLAMTGNEMPTRVATFIADWMAIEIALEFMLDYSDRAMAALSNLDNKSDIETLNIYEIKESYMSEAKLLRQELADKFHADANISELVSNMLAR